MEDLAKAGTVRANGMVIDSSDPLRVTALHVKTGKVYNDFVECPIMPGPLPLKKGLMFVIWTRRDFSNPRWLDTSKCGPAGIYNKGEMIDGFYVVRIYCYQHGTVFFVKGVDLGKDMKDLDIGNPIFLYDSEKKRDEYHADEIEMGRRGFYNRNRF
jgi:hypothetical protein